MALLTEKQLAEKGALTAVLELREQIDAIQKAYPGVIMAERVAKMKATNAAKAAAGVGSGSGSGAESTAAAPAKQKKSHKKKKAASLGATIAGAAAAGTTAAAAGEAGAEAPAQEEAAAPQTPGVAVQTLDEAPAPA